MNLSTSLRPICLLGFWVLLIGGVSDRTLLIEYSSGTLLPVDVTETEG